MNGMPKSLDELVDSFSKLPGVGKKTAERLAIHILRSSFSDVQEFTNALTNVKTNIDVDEISSCFKENGVSINDDSARDNSVLCIVKDATEVFLIEKSGYRGHYHVLGGLLSPLDGVMPENLNIDNLLNIIDNYKELIIAIDPNSKGDTTSLYIKDLLKNRDIKITRLARGVPVGSSLDYIDELTLTHSIEDRVEIK
tara:strand:- start:697 stop:1287 length:591 start_codon:yes stop_codon:yes gene_type:complete